EYRYRQDSDFYYLSGFAEPEAVLCLIPGRPQGEFVMFCRERDREMEIWNGYRAGPEGAVADFGASDAFPITDLDDIIPGLIEGRERVFVSMGAQPLFDQRLMGWVNSIRAKARSGLHAPGEFMMLDHLLHDLRLFKSAEEIKIMRRAAAISSRAHVRAMQTARAGLYEYELEAELMHEFLRGGCPAPAYNSIVGSGANACILHYVENNRAMQDGDLVLIDAGGELDHYASDITRTFPVNGRFSPEQKAIYELVLTSQLAAIESVKPGAHWNTPHECVVNILTDGLLSLGLLQGSFSECVAKESYRQFFMHRTGHWLGMDVHDVGDYKIDNQWRELEPGMVMTVEPGLYIAPDCMTVDAKWRGIGVRIEDDVLVTKTGHDVLTQAAPKTVADIEALMAR
ncbi:MAG: aminopeptidase P N-terminal domain-containing protein, partial [Moraxellaceae bacterium]|nr:aminopeptidase P N-terminal domain-containing protein [Moraxellaceae bacterium]